MADTNDMNLNHVWNTLMFFALPSKHVLGERTGGVLAGCPRKPPPTPNQLAGYAKNALASLREYVGGDAEAWMREDEALPMCKCGKPWVLNTVHRANTPCYLAAEPADGPGVAPTEGPRWWHCKRCQCDAPTENVNLGPTHKTCGCDVTPADDVLAAEAPRWAVFCKHCRKEWNVPYEHPGADVCADCAAAGVPAAPYQVVAPSDAGGGKDTP